MLWTDYKADRATAPWEDGPAETGTVEDYEDWLDLPEPCPACGGESFELGVLGRLTWLRCTRCGINHYRKEAA